MKVNPRPDFKAAVLTPEAGDQPEDLEDAVHDELLRAKTAARAVVQIVLDLSEVPQPAPWLKAAGPELPDTNLRIALGEAGYRAARVLQLNAHFEWYSDVESALRAGG